MNATAIRAKRPSRAVIQARKKRQPSTRRLETLLGLFVIVAIFSLFAGWVTQSSTFRVKRVLFEGAYVLPEQDVLAAAGITTEDNIFFLDTAVIAERVEALPYVKRCEVKRRYPDEVMVRLVERKAIATVMVNNHLFEIDSEYVVLRELSPYAQHTGPMITNLPAIAALEPGFEIQNDALANALELWESFKTLSFSREVALSEISAERPNDLRMYFDELPYEIRWGRSDFQTQAARLDVLWHEMSGKLPCNFYLDLRFDADFVCK